ncbi:uncharacterized protein LOC122312621 [Carya illinoinensis]|uniref:uncharacterized protein LOC122312621 n=1 Tax=Carya illinoinensis TaxID=32201 RepID=UPI001C71F7E9|nr:uncharacterized protein LOC122312621 [Carya illinoinensis]
MGPFPPGKGGVKFMIVTVDYFTKWVEAELLATITSKTVTKFLWKNVICGFKILQSIITDNGRQLDSDHYKEWCAELRIKAKYSSSGHPQANGQVEATNKALISILKKKVAEKKGDWANELPRGHGPTRREAMRPPPEQQSAPPPSQIDSAGWLQRPSLPPENSPQRTCSCLENGLGLHEERTKLHHGQQTRNLDESSQP